MDDYPVKLGAMLYTLVDPNRGHEVAYNRWYERDHFYGGCMTGPGILAGGRWVATRQYKDLRFPADSTVAEPVVSGSYLATYWVAKGEEKTHFEWSSRQVFDLYRDGRGFDERTHAHTCLYTHQRDFYRDPDGVPVELALDHRFGGLVSVHVDRSDEVKHQAFDEWFAEAGAPIMLNESSDAALMCSWRPIIPRPTEGAAPMKLGSGPGTPQRSMQLFFFDSDPADSWERVVNYCEAVNDSKLATVRLAAPFIPTVVGTDTYTDQLW